MSITCRQESCTIAETGACLLNNDVSTCPNRLSGDSSDQLEDDLAPPLTPPPQNPSFPRSLTLSPQEATGLMGKNYCRLIGILGAPDAGKTAALVSLYLLAAQNQLEGFRYANSRTLMALDEISQGARRWNDGQLPEQLTVHTELADDRTAGFLHLRVRRTDSEVPFDILMPDLPGEWSTNFVDSNRIDRLAFLQGADVIWLMVDGVQLSTPATRQAALHRTKILMHKVSSFLNPSPPVFLVITRRDQATPSEATLAALRAEAELRGLQLEIFTIASFAKDGLTKPGAGIAELVTASIIREPNKTELWPDKGTRNFSESRSMMRYRMTEVK